MSENQNELSTKSKIKKFLKHLFILFILFLIIGIIAFIIFYNYFEVDGFADYSKNKINNLAYRLETVKNFYSQGRYIDAYNYSHINSYSHKTYLIESYKCDYVYNSGNNNYNKEEDDDDDDEDKDENEDEDEDEDENKVKNIKQKDKKEEEEISNDYNLKIEYEIRLLNETADIMKRRYITKIYHSLSYLGFLNKILPKKMHIPIKYQEEIASYRIFKKYNSIPEIYNFAKKISTSSDFNVLKKMICAKLYFSCGDYKDSKKLSANLFKDVLLNDVLSIKKFNLDDYLSIYIGTKYHSSRNWSQIIMSENLIDYIYYYLNLGGDIQELKTKFNEFIKALYEEAEKEYNEVVTLKTEYNKQKTSLKYRKKLKKINLMKEKLNDASRKYNYLNSLHELKEAYYVTKFEIDSDYIKKSENCINKYRLIDKEIMKYLEELKETHSEEEDDDDENEEEEEEEEE